MKILGMGLPELFMIIIPLFFISVAAAVAYFVIKAAVKRAVVEAHDEIERRGPRP